MTEQSDTTDTAGVSGEQLKSIIERIENLNEEIDGLKGDVKDIYSEAKGVGFDVPILRSIIRLRKKSREERQEEEALLETYMQALGMN